MAKNKRVEEKTPNIQLDLTEDIVEAPAEVINTPTSSDEERKAVVSQKRDTSDKGLINCLRNERVIVRFVPKPSMMVQNPRHILYGGMAKNATRSFVVPRYNSTGMFVNVLTNAEKDFLEYAMGLEINALSVYKRKDNFWDDSNPLGIGKVTLHKQDNYLNLSIPEDYIKYKILLANKDQIASSLQELEDRPKATYQFVIISEKSEAQSSLSKMDITMECYMELGRIKDDASILRVIIELIEGRPTAPRVKLEFLQGKAKEFIDSNPRRFLSTIKDELLPYKVLIKQCVEAGLISTRNNLYYLRQDGSPLCELGEDSTLNNTAKYLSSPKHSELKYTLEAKLKED